MYDEKLLIDKDVRNLLWKILLFMKNFDEDKIGKVWMLASGAASLMHINKEYYFNIRDSMPFYPNPCFNQIELDLKRTFPNDPQD